MKSAYYYYLAFVATLLLSFGNSIGQDSVKAKVIKTTENTIVYKIGKMKFISFGCKCSLRRGDTFLIPKQRFDSLLKEARPATKKDIKN